MAKLPPGIPASADPARERAGRWVPGKSGNPAGRPKGLPVLLVEPLQASATPITFIWQGVGSGAIGSTASTNAQFTIMDVAAGLVGLGLCETRQRRVGISASNS